MRIPYQKRIWRKRFVQIHFYEAFSVINIKLYQSVILSPTLLVFSLCHRHYFSGKCAQWQSRVFFFPGFTNKGKNDFGSERALWIRQKKSMKDRLNHHTPIKQFISMIELGFFEHFNVLFPENGNFFKWNHDQTFFPELAPFENILLSPFVTID